MPPSDYHMAGNSISSSTITLLLIILLHFLLPVFTETTSPYTPIDHILLACGSQSNRTAFDGREWQPDTLSNFLPSNSQTTSLISEPSERDSSVPTIPYMTARIFQSEFTYSFPSLSPGPKFLRLYFYPATYNQTLNKNASFFSVIANQNTLLTNFNAFLTLSTANYSAQIVFKEYIIHINDTHHQLNLTFLPNLDSYAFINGIEIVSIPNDLYFRGDNVPLKTSFTVPYYLKNDQALELLYRLNIGGEFVRELADTGMFRAWIRDNDYVLRENDEANFMVAAFATSLTSSRNVEVNYTSSDPQYTAPEMVYTSARFMNDFYSHSYNMTWVFPVDSGFYYLLRLHFCEFFLEIRKPGDRIFSIFINNQTVEAEADVISWANGPQIVVSKDYVTYVGDPNGQKSNLFLTMKPVSSEIVSLYENTLLNGLEIFKISLSNGSLNYPNPEPLYASVRSVSNKVLPKKNRMIQRWLLILLVTTSGMVASVMVFIGIMIFRRRKRMNDSVTPIGNQELPVIVNSICRHFSFDEMKRATGNFDDNFVIGVGGFGSVYKGCINRGLTEIAVKRLNPSSNQGFSEFRAEIEMLSKLRHLHLVSLIGYCQERGEMILVYDYMANGTLRDHLYNTKRPHLPWKQRLRICVGVARGIHYLHTGSKNSIIHRDIKSTNILLDENYVAKVSDFGLSKIGPISGSKYHISTMVKGSFGYLDPEYFLSQQLTDRSDVYSFGVVLLELLCACPAITQDLSGENISLVDWAHACHKERTLEQIIDPVLKGEIASNCLAKYVEITFKCLQPKGVNRPSMSDVVWNLDFAWQLQEDDEKNQSFKMSMGKNEAVRSGTIVQHGMAERDISYSGSVNYSLTLVR